MEKLGLNDCVPDARRKNRSASSLPLDRNLQFQVSEKGNLTLLTFEVDSVTIQEISNIKSLIHKSLDSLPKIFPAIKRRQQVKTEFELPIIINVK